MKILNDMNGHQPFGELPIGTCFKTAAGYYYVKCITISEHHYNSVNLESGGVANLEPSVWVRAYPNADVVLK